MYYYVDRCIIWCYGNVCMVNYVGLWLVFILIVWFGFNLLMKRIKYFMVEWSGEYISLYVEYGKKSE